MMYKVKLLMSAFIVLAFGCNLAIAKEHDQSKGGNIKVNYTGPHRLMMSAGKLNRLHFSKNRIKKIIGDSSKFKAVVSDNKQDVFVQFYLEEGELFHFACTDIAGKVFDFEVKMVAKDYPITATIQRLDSNEKISKNNEVELMLRAMRRGKVGKYFVQGKSTNFKCANDMAICQVANVYRYRNLRGLQIMVKNKSHLGVEVVSEVSRGLENVVGSYPQALILGPEEDGTIYVVYEVSDAE